MINVSPGRYDVPVPDDLRAELIELKVQFHLTDRRLAALSRELPSNFMDVDTDEQGRPLPEGEHRRVFQLAEVPADLQAAVDEAQAELGRLVIEINRHPFWEQLAGTNRAEADQELSSAARKIAAERELLVQN